MRVPPSAEQIVSFLQRVRRAVTEGRVEIRAYAVEGLRDLEWTAEDLRLQLIELAAEDFLRVGDSIAPQGGIIWVFTPEFWDGGHLWIRLVERAGIVVISFHRG